MSYPMAWFITWTTYGTWLHGDARGSFLNQTYLPPDPEMEEANLSQMTGDAVCLTDQQRAIVDTTLVNECLAQGWQLHARNVRTNHVHLVVSAARPGTFVRTRLKALAAKALSDDADLPMAGSNGRKRWWTEKGNILAVEDEKSLEGITVYVHQSQ
jgi:REP element-mobilizing transposase RayT